MTIQYDIMADNDYHNTFQIWPVGKMPKDFSSDSTMDDDEFVTVFIEIQRKAELFGDLLGTCNMVLTVLENTDSMPDDWYGIKEQLKAIIAKATREVQQ